MGLIESKVLDCYPLASKLWTLLHPRGLLSVSSPGYSTTELSHDCRRFIVRRDNSEPNTVVNIFASGTKVYTLERTTPHSTNWVLYNPSREQIVVVKCGVMSRKITFLNRPNLQSRRIGRPRWLYAGLPDREFYLQDGSSYEWRRQTQFLERIVNRGGGIHEARERLGKVQLLHPFRFEWEVLVDPGFDDEIALATAFISMCTEWPTAHFSSLGSLSIL